MFVSVLCPLFYLCTLSFLLNRVSSFCSLAIPLSGKWFTNIFSHSVGYFFFTFLMVFFKVRKFKIFIKSTYLVNGTFGTQSRQCAWEPRVYRHLH